MKYVWRWRYFRIVQLEFYMLKVDFHVTNFGNINHAICADKRTLRRASYGRE